MSSAFQFSIRIGSIFDSLNWRIDSNRFGFPKNRTFQFDHSLESVCNIWLWLYCRCYSSRHKGRKNECQDINLPPALPHFSSLNSRVLTCPTESIRIDSNRFFGVNRIEIIFGELECTSNETESRNRGLLPASVKLIALHSLNTCRTNSTGRPLLNSLRYVFTLEGPQG